jgi:hypothetical protein
MRTAKSHVRMLALLLLIAAACAGCWASAAIAATPAGGLSLHVLSEPDSFSAADDHDCFEDSEYSPENYRSLEPCDQYQVTVTDAGSEATGAPIVLQDHLPAGMHVGTVTMFEAFNQVSLEEEEAPAGVPVGGCETLDEGTIARCELGEALQPDQRLEMDFRPIVEPGAPSGAENVAEAIDAGTVVALKEVKDEVTPGDEAPEFGARPLVSEINADDGTPDTQAGDHPYEFVTRVGENTKMGNGPTGLRVPAGVDGGLRDVVVDLPLGMVGDAQATPKCTLAQLQSRIQCPADTLVGHIATEPLQLTVVNSPVYNLVPEHGVAAELGFLDQLHGTHVIDASLAPTPTGYVLQAVAREIPDVTLWSALTTIYGDPAARNASGETPTAMFTNPADCSGEPLVSKVYIDSWEDPGSFNADGTPNLQGPGWAEASSESPPVTDCGALRFSPEAFSVQPDTTTADSQTGLSVELKVPQDESPETLATPPLRDSTVTLPTGVIPNPAAAGGLTGCSETQIGWLGPVGPPGENPGLTNFTEAAPTCPVASKIGAVEVTTPLLEKPLTGALYLAEQDNNPFGAILAAYIVVDDPALGIVVKIPGKITLNEGTGQATGVFDEAPQTPFSDLKLRFFGGTPGELATPVNCGTYTTSGVLTPWSAPQSGPPASESSGFQIDSGCSPGFAPTFAAGTSSPQAGSYSPFALSFARQDSEQEVSDLTVTLPPGVSARIAGVGKCPEADIEAAAQISGKEEIADPSCPASSEVGTVEAGSGVGPDPLQLPGTAYLTGPYKGAPLGLATIVPAVTGPFDLGNVVVRTALYIDPSDAHVTAVSDPFPTIVDAKGADGVTDGFPDRLRTIDVTLNRSAYVLNPTNCSPMSVGAAFTSTTGATSSSTARFQVGGCGELGFKPSFTVSTQGHASKADGESLHVVIKAKPGEANIGKLRIELPKQLPSRQTTLEKACLVSVFDANPAACPEGSLVGMATAVSPLIATPFTGPAYLVSHGAQELPHLDIVLQSEDITIVLDNKIKIKKGITTSIQETVPDTPVTSFELTFPTGPHSILGTFIPEKLRYNLCTQKLTMPTLITGQNGAIVQQSTHIAITGCAARRKAAKRKAPKRKAPKRKR